jgi:hypothetical protein
VNLSVFGPDGAKKGHSFHAGRKERSEALSIPGAPQGGAEASTARKFAARGAAQAGWTEGAERSLEFAWKRMSSGRISRRLLQMAIHGEFREQGKTSFGRVNAGHGSH